jgi:DNA-binding HxlR family transcriptional regulator
MRLFDLLGRRWALRIVWELRDAPATFRALRERCEDVSPSVLNVRLRELRDAGLVEASEESGYALSPAALSLLPTLGAVGGGARAHLRGPRSG